MKNENSRIKILAWQKALFALFFLAMVFTVVIYIMAQKFIRQSREALEPKTITSRQADLEKLK